MKTTSKQKWFTLLLIISTICTRAQINFKCENTSAGPGNPPPPVITCGNILDVFAPTASSINDTINVNMVFFKPASGVGIYDTITISTPLKLLSMINSKWSTFNAPHLINNPPAPLISDSKIRFRLKSFSKIVDSLGYKHVGYSSGSVAHLYPYIDSNAINIFWAYDFATSGCGGGGYSWDIPHYCISMGLCGIDFPINYSEGLGHEFGHALGLPHTDEIANNGSVFATDYVVEDTSIWAKTGPCATTPPTVSLAYSNNIMAYNWQCRKYLSPEQIGFVKYLLKAQYLTKRFLKNNTNYATCDVDHSKDYNVTSNQTWSTPKVFYGDVTVKSGNKLIINCEVSFGIGAKLIIEKGAKVTINTNGKLFSHCTDLWGGVEVEGDSYSGQVVDSVTKLNGNQGILEIFGGKIQDAYIGVALYKRDTSNNLINGTTGGIVFCKDGIFFHNYISVEFMPYDYIYHDPSLHYNFCYFKNTLFQVNKSIINPLAYPSPRLLYKSNTNPKYGISLNGVRSVKIAGCSFIDDDFNTVNHINALDAGVNVQSYCTNLSGSTCTGTLIHNKFDGGSYGIYISNTSGYYYSIIDSARFGYNFPAGTGKLYQVKGGIYINNASYSQITNNIFKLSSSNVGNMKYGIYVDNSTGYIIEGNSFSATPVNLRKNSAGIYINNSGPYANSVYNNTFLDLDQGIWAQNENVDVTTGVGLKMNCNDFTTCKYNVGVQKSGRSLINNTGVDYTQGIADPFIQTNNVRNTYDVVPTSCGSENKFYVNTSNTFYTNHGSFLGSQYHPTPQPACSNMLELIDVSSPNPPVGVKSTYCPSTITSTFTSRYMQVKIRELQNAIQNQEAELNILANNTQTARTANTNGATTGENMLGNYQMAQAKLNLNKTELGLLVNEKIRRSLCDTSANATDSILSIIDNYNLPKKQILKVAVNLSAKRYNSASNQINQNKNIAGLKDYSDVQKTVLDYYGIAPNQRKQFVLQNKAQLLQWAESYDMFLEGAAKGLLASAGMPVEEEKLYPVTENNMRLTQSNEITEENKGSIRIYPNPASNSITIELENNNSNLIELRDVTGKLLLTQSIEFKGQIDLNNLENGVYLVNLVSEKAIVHSTKIVLIK